MAFLPLFLTPTLPIMKYLHNIESMCRIKLPGGVLTLCVFHCAAEDKRHMRGSRGAEGSYLNI